MNGGLRAGLQLYTLRWICTGCLPLDLVSIDTYPFCLDIDAEYGLPFAGYRWENSAMTLALARGFKEDIPFWVTETQAGLCGEIMAPIRKNQLTLWAAQQLFYGSKISTYFPFRTCRFGSEQTLFGLIDWDDRPSPRFKEAADVSRMTEKLGDIRAFRHKAKVAILRDFVCDWIFGTLRLSGRFRYLKHIGECYRALLHAGIACDIVSMDTDFSAYDVLLLPSAVTLKEETAQRLEAFVKEGGRVIVTALSSYVNEESNFTTDLRPRFLTELCGCRVEDMYEPEKAEGISYYGASLRADYWCEQIALSTGRPAAVYDSSSYFGGTPAIVENTYGRGTAYYLATILDADGYERFFEDILSDCLSPVRGRGVETIPGVLADDTPCVAVINHSDQVQTVRVPENYRCLFSRQENAVPGRVPQYDIQVWAVSTEK